MTEDQNHSNNRPRKDGDLTAKQKDAIRSVANMKALQMAAIVEQIGIEETVTSEYLDRFLDPEVVTVVTEKLPREHTQTIRNNGWALNDRDCLKAVAGMAEKAALKLAMSFGGAFVDVASLHYMPEYLTARFVVQLGHDAGYRPAEKAPFLWDEFKAAVKTFLSYGEYQKAMNEANRVFKEAIPYTRENILALANRNTFFLDVLKECKPERPQSPKKQEETLQPANESEPGPMLPVDDSSQAEELKSVPEDEVLSLVREMSVKLDEDALPF